MLYISSDIPTLPMTVPSFVFHAVPHLQSGNMRGKEHLVDFGRDGRRIVINILTESQKRVWYGLALSGSR
jgi:hypothetical protein